MRYTVFILTANLLSAMMNAALGVSAAHEGDGWRAAAHLVASALNCAVVAINILAPIKAKGGPR